MIDNSDTPGSAFNMRGDWKVQSDLLKGKFPQLTDEDLEFEQGSEKELLRRMEKKLNLKREEVIEIIKFVQPDKRIFKIFPRHTL